jgi:hypothetical protein
MSESNMRSAPDAGNGVRGALRFDTLPLLQAVQVLEDEAAFHKRMVRQHRARLAECLETRSRLLESLGGEHDPMGGA